MMTRITLAAVAALLVATIGCSKKEADGLMVQAHDDNVFMQIMHSSMDSMMTMRMTMDPDHDFAKMMRMHHMGAVEMAEKQLAIGQDATIKGMAQLIKTAQMSEIAQLDSFMAAHTPMMDMVKAEPFEAESDSAMMKMERGADLLPLTGKADFDFSQLMVVHHQSAIEMANAVIKNGDVPFIRRFAEKVIIDQNKEIGQFQSWMLTNRPYGSGMGGH